MIDIKVPTVGESISEVTLLKWVKDDGQYVDRDEVIAELESEKATFEVNAEKAGTLKQSAKEGDTLKIGDILASIDESAAKPAADAAPPREAAKPSGNGQARTEASSSQPAAVAQTQEAKPQETAKSADVKATPVASAIIADKKVDPKTVTPSGFKGKILKEDVLNALSNPGRQPGTALFSRDEKRDKMS